MGIDAHARAKRLNLLASLALARRWQGNNVKVNTVNPGMAWTSLTQGLTPEAVPAWRYIWPVVRFFQRRASPSKAALGPLALATPSAPGLTGRYFDGLKEQTLEPDLLDGAEQERALDLAEACLRGSIPDVLRNKELKP